jgi:hypothetical protein
MRNWPVTQGIFGDFSASTDRFHHFSLWPTAARF